MSRSVIKVVQGKWQCEGQGAKVRRTIGTPELKNCDPFLLLDDFCVIKPAGFPNHPHRGFETVTYVLKGAIKHKDFTGNEGTIGPGDLQWMTAGRGVIHSEMPVADGENLGLQLWINLRKADKMVPPAYQDLSHKEIPVASTDGVRVLVIAGEALGVRSPVRTKTPTMYLDFEVANGGKLRQPIPSGWTAIVYILDGQIHFGDPSGSQTACKARCAVQFSDGDSVEFENKDDFVCRFILIAGQPLGEPVVQHGPFVMTSEKEIEQTILDFQMKQNGFEGAADYN